MKWKWFVQYKIQKDNNKKSLNKRLFFLSLTKKFKKNLKKGLYKKKSACTMNNVTSK